MATLGVVSVRETEWLRVEWDSAPNEPSVLYSAFGDDRVEKRKIEHFDSGIVGFAESFAHTRFTILGTVPVPSAEEIDSQPEFTTMRISRSQFEAAWNVALDEAFRSSETFRCRCCGTRGLRKPALGTYEICATCHWEDDPAQAADQTRSRGKNELTLIEHRTRNLAWIAHQLRAPEDRLGEPTILVDRRQVDTASALGLIQEWLAVGDSIIYKRTAPHDAPPGLAIERCST